MDQDQNTKQTQEQLEAMKRLLSPEGAAELQSKMGPMQLTAGAMPLESKSTTGLIEPRPVADRSTITVPGVPGQEQVLFTLAPVYFAVAVPFDIVSQFLGSVHGPGATVERIRVPFPVTPDVPGWENVLETINPTAFNGLMLFLGECAFQRNSKYWTICGDMVTIPLPGGGARPVAVFTPRGLAIRLRPWVDDTGAIRFTSENVFEKIQESDFVKKLANVREVIT